MAQHIFWPATDATDFSFDVPPPRTATDLQHTGRRGFSMFYALPRTQRTFVRSNVMRAHAHAHTCFAIRQKSVAPVAQHVFCWIRIVESVASPWRGASGRHYWLGVRLTFPGDVGDYGRRHSLESSLKGDTSQPPREWRHPASPTSPKRSFPDEGLEDDGHPNDK